MILFGKNGIEMLTFCTSNFQSILFLLSWLIFYFQVMNYGQKLDKELAKLEAVESEADSR